MARIKTLPLFQYASADAASLKALVEKDRVYEFLLEFDPVRIQILGKDDTSSLKEVISIIVAEKSRMDNVGILL